MEKPIAASALGGLPSRPPTLPTPNLTSTLGIYNDTLLKRIVARRTQEQTKKVSVPSPSLGSPASTESLISPSQNQPLVTAADGRVPARSTPGGSSSLLSTSPSLVELVVPNVSAADGRSPATMPIPRGSSSSSLLLRSPSLVPFSEPSAFAPDDSYAAMIPRIPGAILTPPFQPKKERPLHQTTRIPSNSPTKTGEHLSRETASEGVPHIRREVRRDPALVPFATIESVKHRAPQVNAKYVFLMILALIFIFHRKLF